MTRENDTRATDEVFAPGERGRFGERESSRKTDSYKSDLVDVSLLMHAETAKAIRVSDNGNDSRACWLPKSLIEFEKSGVPVRLYGHPLQPVTVTLPEWKAKQAGLI